MSEPTTPATEVGPEEVVPDYSRVGFRDLQKLCKARGLPGDGGSAALVDRLKAYDLQHGKDVDLSALDDSDPDFDPLADDEPAPAAQEQPAGSGEAASVPPPAGLAAPAAPPAPAAVASEVAPRLRRGQPDLSTRTGVHVVGQGSQGPSRVFRAEFPIGDHELSDTDHFRYIADTHVQAQTAGHTTRGGSTIGERVSYAADEHGRRTVIYQVTLKREL